MKIRWLIPCILLGTVFGQQGSTMDALHDSTMDALHDQTVETLGDDLLEGLTTEPGELSLTYGTTSRQTHSVKPVSLGTQIWRLQKKAAEREKDWQQITSKNPRFLNEFMIPLDEFINKLPQGSPEDVKLVWTAVKTYNGTWPYTTIMDSFMTEDAPTPEETLAVNAILKYFDLWKEGLFAKPAAGELYNLTNAVVEKKLAASLPYARVAVAYLRYYITLNPMPGNLRSKKINVELTQKRFSEFKELVEAERLEEALHKFGSDLVDKKLDISAVPPCFPSKYTNTGAYVALLQLIVAAYLVN